MLLIKNVYHVSSEVPWRVGVNDQLFFLLYKYIRWLNSTPDLYKATKYKCMGAIFCEPPAPSDCGPIVRLRPVCSSYQMAQFIGLDMMNTLT